MELLDTLFSLPSNAAEDLRSLGTGLRTAGAEFIKPIVDVSSEVYTAPKGQKTEAIKKAFKNAVDNDRTRRLLKGAAIGAGVGSTILPAVGTVGGAITGGLAGVYGPKNLVNATLSTYNTSVEDILSGNINPKEMVKGALSHPVYTALDLAGVGGLGKSIGKTSKVGVKSTRALEELLPGKELSEFNRELTTSKLWSQARQADVYGSYNTLSSKPLAKRQEIVKKITTGEGKLSARDSKLADNIIKDLRTNEERLAQLGMLDKDFSRNNTVAQYVMSNISSKSNLLHKDILDIIDLRELRPVAKEMFKDKALGASVLKLIDKGEDLYDQGKIALLTQQLAPSVDPLGNVTARQFNLANQEYLRYPRVIGRSTPEQLGNVLDESIKLQLDKVAQSRQGIDIFSDALDSKLIGDLSKEEKATAVKAFRDSLAKDIQTGVYPDLQKALKNSAVEKKIERKFYKALEGVMRKPTSSALQRFLNSWKKTVLGNPGWIMGNRLGNWSNNAIEGVTLADYADVKKYRNLIPNQLKQQTSYNSYINMGAEGIGKVSASSAIAEPIVQIQRGIGAFKESDKGLGAIGKLASELVGGTSNLTANPFFKIEASLELADRSANFIRQAKRYAEKNKMSVEKVLKLSNKDKAVFNELNTQVNKSLGDYFGKNYAAPQPIHEVLGELFPFYRFPLQTARTTFHQVANNPLAFATNITIPARGGSMMYNNLASALNLDKEKYKGGLPYKQEDKNIRTFGLIPAPIGIIGERFADPKELTSMLNPVIGSIPDILEYKKFGKTPTSPTLTKLKLIDPSLAEEYKGSNSDRALYALNTLIGNIYNPWMLLSRYGVNIARLLQGEGAQTLYDTHFWKTNPETYKKTLPLELLGNILGDTPKSNYPITRRSLRKAKANRRKINYTKQNIIKQKGK